MASEELLNILKQGVGDWNQWREVNLSEAGLPRANLSGADLEGVFLAAIDLRAANLRAANLSEADLREADLSDADLREADLSDANLSNANLSNANLRFANLRFANLSRALLGGADLTNTVIGFSTIGSVDLSKVKGLETVKHVGPSSIGIDTIYLSNGDIPDAFLKGAGVPDNFIAYIASLVGKAIEYYSCFISYSSKDHEFASRLYNDLQGKGVRSWFAPEDLKIGEKFRIRIDESIRLHDKLLLILSKHSVTSDWVEKEVETAFEKESDLGKLVLFPVRLDDAVMEIKTGWPADIKRTRHIGDFRRWKDHDEYQKAFGQLLRALKGESEK
jgi:hypothetical protein